MNRSQKDVHPQKINLLIQRVQSAIIISLISGFSVYTGGFVSILYFSILYALIVKEWIAISNNASLSLKHHILGLIFLFFIFSYFLYLSIFAPVIIAQIVLIASSTDIFAYAIGNIVGGPKIIPAISPNKTWSGFIGGIIPSTILSSYLGISIYEEGYSTVILFLLSLASQLGDFIESKYKRSANIKDSGNLIPGHGGILDRADSIIAVATLWIILSFIY